MPLPQVPHDTPVERLAVILSHESPAVLIEREDGRMEILTKFDLVSAVAGLVEQIR